MPSWDPWSFKGHTLGKRLAASRQPETVERQGNSATRYDNGGNNCCWCEVGGYQWVRWQPMGADYITDRLINIQEWYRSNRSLERPDVCQLQSEPWWVNHFLCERPVGFCLPREKVCSDFTPTLQCDMRRLIHHLQLFFEGGLSRHSPGRKK